MKYLFSIITLLVTLISFQSEAQQGKLSFSAARLSGSTINGVRFNIFESSPAKRVIIKQGTTTVFCNKATENSMTKDVTAVGNVIVKQESMKIYGETMYYYQKDGLVIITGKEVKMVQEDMVLTTDKLYYNMNTGNAYYVSGGHVIQKQMDLTSQIGYMRRDQNLITFKRLVVMKDTVKNQTIETDTMAYNTTTQVATFPTNTFIKSKEGYVLAQFGGKFLNATQEIFFTGKTMSQTIDYALEANDLYLNDSLDYGIAKYDVKLKMKKEKINIFGDEMRYNGGMTNTKAYGHAYMEMPINKGDTLFLSADTLYSVVDEEDNRTMFAYNNVQIYSKQMQGTCDSLKYSLVDSMIYFYNEPVLWSQGSQITGNTISAKLEEDDIDKMFIDSDSYIVSKDSLGNYNQIKGKEMVAHFNQGFIRKVDIEGNGETIYNALEGDTLFLGLNYINCSRMVVYFADSNQISDITYITNPEQKFIPPHELKEEDKTLKDFNPQFDKTPSQALVYRLKNKLDAIKEEDEKTGQKE